MPTGAEPEGVAVSEDGKIVYVTSEVSDMVHVVDAQNGAVLDNIVVGTRPRRFALTPDRKELWVSAELSGEIYIIDRATNQVAQVLKFLPPGFRQSDVTPVDLTMTQDGKKAFITLGRANHIAIVDTASRKIESYILVGSRPWGVRLTPDEKLLYVANGLSDDVSIVDVGSRTVLKSIPAGRVPWGVLFDD